MTIRFTTGDMFEAQSEALVNTVNCVGVMGKGVALAVKQRWPENFKAYKKLCDDGGLAPGEMFVFDNGGLLDGAGPRYIINFPTKRHWRAKSRLEDISSGLDALAAEIKSLGIRSIVLPPLGCGNGGLDWADVEPLIRTKLAGVADRVDVLVYAPSARQTMTYPRAVLVTAMHALETYFDGSIDRTSLQKIVYFLQVFGVDFNLRFARNAYGPYSETLRDGLKAMTGAGMIAGFDVGERLSTATDVGLENASAFLSGESARNTRDVIHRLSRLIEGYESPYGMELLASVHWLTTERPGCDVQAVVAAMSDWNDRKRSAFSPEAIALAYDRLVEDGLVAKAA